MLAADIDQHHFQRCEDRIGEEHAQNAEQGAHQ